MAAKPAQFLDHALKAYIYNTARKNFYRVAAWYELEDLVADGYLCYAKCLNRYADTVTDQPHFMALFKTAYFNHIMSLAGDHNKTKMNERTVSQFRSPDAAFSDDAIWERLAPAEQESSTILSLIKNAPSDIAELLGLIAGDGAEALGFERSKVKGFRHNLRETTNEYFCRLVGRDPAEFDMVARVKTYFAL